MFSETQVIHTGPDGLCRQRAACCQALNALLVAPGLERGFCRVCLMIASTRNRTGGRDPVTGPGDV
ncbi:hypothetical protein KKI24_23725 [bacterium]|nr:hypothetical protein [bacterium]